MIFVPLVSARIQPVLQISLASEETETLISESLCIENIITSVLRKKKVHVSF